MHLVWNNKAVDIQDVGALILVFPLFYYIVPFSTISLFKNHVLPLTKGRCMEYSWILLDQR